VRHDWLLTVSKIEGGCGADDIASYLRGGSFDRLIWSQPAARRRVGGIDDEAASDPGDLVCLSSSGGRRRLYGTSFQAGIVFM
jgi:hypothetical protein